MKIIFNNSFDINIKDMFFCILKKSWLIILITILCSAGAWYYSSNYIQPYYISTSKLYMINKPAGYLTTLTDLQTGSSLAKDFAILIKSRPVMEEVIKSLNLNMPSEVLAGSINVLTPTDTRVVNISVTHYYPDMAKKIVDAVAEVAAERMVSIMGMEKVNIVEEGNYPYSPASPNIRKITLMAGGAGAVVTSFFIILLYLLDSSIKRIEDVERYTGLVTLGLIPRERKKRSGRAVRAEGLHARRGA